MLDDCASYLNMSALCDHSPLWGTIGGSEISCRSLVCYRGFCSASSKRRKLDDGDWSAALPSIWECHGGNFLAVDYWQDKAEALSPSLPGVDPRSALYCGPLERLSGRQEVFTLANLQLFMEHLVCDQSCARCVSWRKKNKQSCPTLFGTKWSAENLTLW